MRLTAYVLAADPAFLTESLLAYYPYVDRIVVSYDEDARSWTGTPLPVEECLRAIARLDTARKCVLAPGHYAREGYEPLENETFQRQRALDLASESADWVLQLDTDEVMARPATFLRSLANAEAAGAHALDYPSRWLYARVGPGTYLESSTRAGRLTASYPGALAVRAGTVLRHCRQSDAPLYRVDVRPWNTDPYHPRDVIVHEVVPESHAVVHFSWVRSDEAMQVKFGWSGHAAEYTRPAVYDRWRWRSDHPRATVLSSVLRRTDRFRLSRISDPPAVAAPVAGERSPSQPSQPSQPPTPSAPSIVPRRPR